MCSWVERRFLDHVVDGAATVFDDTAFSRYCTEGLCIWIQSGRVALVSLDGIATDVGTPPFDFLPAAEAEDF